MDTPTVVYEFSNKAQRTRDALVARPRKTHRGNMSHRLVGFGRQLSRLKRHDQLVAFYFIAK